ncbi:MAG: Jag N-terminal domain-containing protein [Pseudomonadota bacterium]|nr:Jag N-terminal domain-containing protein [Pseudomonadota bacterium]
MSTELEFEGKDICDAVEKACFAHQVTEADLEYEVIRHESKKLFGFIGGKNALIRVVKKEVDGNQLVQDLIKSTFGDEFNGSDKKNSGKSKRPDDNRLDTDNSKIVSSSEERIIPEFDDEKISSSLSRVLQLMDVPESVVNTSKRENELHLDIQGEELDILTNKRGAALDALQFIINKMHGVKGGRIFIDCDGFRAQHEEDISGLALRLGAKAKRLRKPVTINSLNAHDRRLVHMALQDDQELRSRSKGDGEFKKVVIYPNNAQRRRPRPKAPATEAV